MLLSNLMTLNLEYLIRQEILLNDISENMSFVTEIKQEPLKAIDDLEKGIKEDMHRAYSSANNSWVYDLYNEGRYGVTLYKNGIEIDRSVYNVDYIKGVIYFTRGYALTLRDIDIITADYTCLLVDIIKGYPYEIENDEFNYKLPLITIEGGRAEEIPFELGHLTGLYKRRYTFNIFALNEMQRDLITDILIKNFRINLDFLDYINYIPLDKNGDINMNYERVVLGNMYFTNLVSDVIHKDKPNHRQRYWGYVAGNLIVNI